MKCTNSVKLFAYLLLFMFFCTSCASSGMPLPYQENVNVSHSGFLANLTLAKAEGFADDICIVSEDITENADVFDEESGAAGLFDVNKAKAIYARNVHEKMYPASLTKVMTALVALENGSLNQVLTCSKPIYFSESKVQVCGIAAGDTMTLNQALRIMLMHSANDAAILIAENIAGSVDEFVDMMNIKAKEIGATNTHFTNPHGLNNIDHYTTAYDLYLMFNEAIKYDVFTEIINMTSYQTEYQNRNGGVKNFNKKTTNLYLRGERTAPNGVTVVGGKSGTTNASGHCLILLSRDVSGNPFISVVLRSPNLDSLYTEMKDLLEEIVN